MQGPPQQQQTHGGDPAPCHPHDDPRPRPLERDHVRRHQRHEHKERGHNTKQSQCSSASLPHSHAVEEVDYHYLEAAWDRCHHQGRGGWRQADALGRPVRLYQPHEDISERCREAFDGDAPPLQAA
jgi:hypothetical protein